MMIKKLLSVVTLFLVTQGTISAQNSYIAQPAEFNPANTSFNSSATTLSNKVATAAVSDTLWYFYKKHIYRNSGSNLLFFTFRSPGGGVSHMGSRFNNTGTITVNGLEGIASRKASSSSASVTARLYLCNVVAGTPVFPPIDSVSSVLTGTAGTFFGGNFTTPKTVTGDFAVLIRTGYTLGDTILPYMNNANTATSTTTLTSSKFGEGFGYLRVASNGNFTTTTSFFTLPTTGGTSDCEFMVAPRVTYAITADHSVTQSTVCTNAGLNYPNTSSAWLNNRQFNFNVFVNTWTPFLTAPPNTNQVYTWNFGDGSPVSNATSPSKTYALTGTFNGTLTANLVKLSAVRPNSVTPTAVTDNKNWTITASICTNIKTNTLNSGILVYPNPSVNGKLTIANIEGVNTIIIYNMLGMVIESQKTDKSQVTIDLSNQPSGNYFLKIIDSNNSHKTIKVINQ